MVGKIVNGIMAICSLIGGGYMIFQGESIGWIIAGFVGGAFAPIAVVAIPAGIIEGFFGKSKGSSAGGMTPSDRRLAEAMWAAGGRRLS
jgi:hypothetical protein